LGGNFSRAEQIRFLAATVILLALALNGWWLILKHNVTLFREEARVIWPGSIVLLLAATWLAYAVADSVIKRGRMDYIFPLAFGGLMLAVLLVPIAKLGDLTKRSDIVRGDSGRRRSRSGLPPSPASEEKVAAAPTEQDNAGSEPPSVDSVS
jgi:hypothetical protein